MLFLFDHQNLCDYSVLGIGIAGNDQIDACGHSVASFVAASPDECAAQGGALSHEQAGGGGNLNIAIGSKSSDASLAVKVGLYRVWKDLDIKFTANYPANLESEAEVAKSLEGVVSKETQLKAISLVDNVADELERLEAEQTPSVVDNIFGA